MNVVNPKAAARYAAWTQEAHRLVRDWLVEKRLPRLDDPVVHRWECDQRLESHTVIAWSSGAFDRGWAPRIHAVIQEACVRDAGVWRWQWPAYREILDRFFGVSSAEARLDLVTVTPSRVPSGIWRLQGRPLLRENTYHRHDELGISGRRNELHLPELCSFSLPLDGLVWTRRDNHPSQHLRVVRTTSFRQFLHFRMTLDRLFEIDPDSDDADGILFGAVPALREVVTGTGLTARTYAPMIHFLRLDADGMIDLLLLETSRDTGRLVDIRWGRQSFAAVMIHDPYYAVALAETCRSGRRLRAT